MKRLYLLLAFLCITSVLLAQNIAITDDDGYSADPSAMLDVKSTTKGMLVPRMNTVQRLAISSPATGLLVFDTSLLSFFYYNGLTWTDLSVPLVNVWETDGAGVYLSDTTLKMGVGTLSAGGKLEIQGDGSGGVGELIFAVKNSTGDTVFAVYDGGVRIYVDDSGTKGAKGGFAVGGFSSGKGTITNDYLSITPDSVRIYVDDSPTVKGAKGGFAVGGFSSGKTLTNDYLTVSRDSVRVYVDNSATKGAKGGFAVGGFSSGKSTPSDFMQLTEDNYFIGLGAGYNNETGLYNSFMGYNAGFNNIYGNRNIFLGYQAGYNNTGDAGTTGGDYNIFIGNSSGFQNTTGRNNLFFGYQAGRSNLTGNFNVFMGYNAGYGNTIGKENTYIGYNVASDDTTGFNNVYIGYYAAANAQQGGSLSSDKNYWNVVIGSYAGQNLFGSTGSCFVGYGAGRNTTTGNMNSFFGGEAGEANTTGAGNTAIGYKALEANQGSGYNTSVGTMSGFKLATGARNAFLGYYVGWDFESGSYNVFLGAESAKNKTGGTGNILIGYQTGSNDASGSGDYNVAIGHQAGYTGSGDKNVFIGYQAGYSESGSNQLYIDNSNTSSPLIYGDFSADELTINGQLTVTGTTEYSGLLSANNGLDVTGNLSVTSDASVTGELTVTDTLQANKALKVFGPTYFSGNFETEGTNTFNGTTVAANNMIAAGTYFRISNAPGSGATPTNYVYQGSTGSISQGDAFSIYDALWVTDNAFFDAAVTASGNISTSGNLSSVNLTSTGTVFFDGVYDTGLSPAGDPRQLYIGSAGRLGYYTSSIRYKTDVANMENISWLYNLRPVNYAYKSDPGKLKRYGLIAEEVGKVNKRFVSYNDKGEPETVLYDQLVSPLIKAVQDQQKQIEQQQDLIQDLLKRIELLESK